MNTVDQLLVTKLTPPALRTALVRRPRLHARLRGALDHPLTVIIAPAGSGKTTALAAWFGAHYGEQGINRPGGALSGDLRWSWISLDESDDDPARFWRYLLAAIELAAPGLTSEAANLLESGVSSSRAEAILTPLLNRLASSGGSLVLAIDDYHLIRTPAIHSGIAFLVERAPPGLRLILAGRSVPPLPLDRLRVRGRVLEIGTDDLRFSLTEAAALLAEGLGLALTPTAVAALVQRTEGWAAGLVLAALAARDRADPAAYAHSFSGASPLVLDYITAEVLGGQSEPIRRFLLDTAALDRLCAELCDAVTGRDGSASMLEQVERAGLFLVALDDERRWFRYHQLFADVLRSRVARIDPQALQTARLRASKWFAARGLISEAIGYALAAEAWNEAADLVASAGSTTLMCGETVTLRGWLDALPLALRQARPALALLDGWLQILIGNITAAEAWAAAAEAGKPDPGELAELRALRAITAMISGHLVDGLDLVSIPADRLPQQPFVQAVQAIARGMHAEFHGLVADAAAAYAEAARVSETSGSLLVSFLAWCQLGETQILQGRLRDAEASYRYADELRRRDPVTAQVVGEAAQIGLGALAFERGNYEQAHALLSSALAGSLVLGDLAAIEAYTYLAQTEIARGQFAAAAAALDRAEELCHATRFSPLLPMVGALRAALDLRRGELARAAAWLAQNQTGDLERMPAGLREQVELGMARVLIALGRLAEALAVLDQVATRAEADGRVRAVIESLVVRSTALSARGRLAAARVARDAAEALAAPAGYVALLEQAAPSEALPAGRLAGPVVLPARHTLTERELEVVRLIAEGLGNDAIARRLVVAPGTVKKHINRIFAKLGAANRTQALIQARALGLLD